MKKLFYSSIIFCVMILTSSVMSQSMQIWDNSGIVPNGTAIYLWGDSSYLSTLICELQVKNISSGTVSAKVKKIENTIIAGSSNTFCYAGNCFPSNVYVSPTFATIASGATDTTFSSDYKPKGHLGESIITYVFFNIADTTDTAWVVVHFHATLAGINNFITKEPEISEPYPNPAISHTSFDYYLPSNAANTRFVLRNILGSTVNVIDIKNSEGKLILNTADIKSGIYLYSFYINDKLILTKKLIVQ